MNEVAVLKTGDCFGELALISQKPRAATIRTSIETNLLVISRKDFDKVLIRIEEANLNKTVDFFKIMPEFRHWTKNALSKLSYFFQRKKYIRNQIVFQEGEPCNHVFIVFSGEFEVIKKKKQLD